MPRTFSDSLAYDQTLQDTDLEYLYSSETAQGALAKSYIGLPF